MSFPNLQLTDAGREIITNAIAGSSINFTRVRIGNGDEPDDIATLTDLQNPLQDMDITEINIEKGTGAALLSCSFDNSSTDGFLWKEIGVYASKNDTSSEDDTEDVLYAYAHAGDYAEYIPAFDNTNYVKTTINIAVTVGDAEDVTATINEYIGYATSDEFNAHTSDTDNPHKVTKSQVGLGNVENYSVNDAPVTYSEASTLSELVSGESTSTAFGKIKKAVFTLIAHLAATNPHNISASMLGAASETHDHKASDITSGTLGISRGGTGGSTSKTALDNLVSGNWIDCASKRGLRAYDTSGDLQTLITLNEHNYVVVGDTELAQPVFLTAYNSETGESVWTGMSTSGVLYSIQESNIGMSGRRWGTVYCSDVNSSSDLKIKENVSDIEKAKEIITGLKPISYNCKGKSEYEMGFGAQDIFELFQNLEIDNAAIYSAGTVGTDNDEGTSNIDDEAIKAENDENLSWGINYNQIIAPLVAVVQQQQKDIEELKKKLEG